MGPRWVVAVVRGTTVLRWAVCDTPADVLAATTDCTAVGVDVPLGLTDARARRCDIEARTRLGRARSSVFPAPPRAALRARNHSEATRISRDVRGVGMSIQAYGLLTKVRTWDDVQPLRPGVVEVHPELSFRAIDPGVSASKKSAPGVLQRLRAVGGAPNLDDPRLARVPIDDALDALACAWTAGRWVAGTAEVLGDETDPIGHPMRIVV